MIKLEGKEYDSLKVTTIKDIDANVFDKKLNDFLANNKDIEIPIMKFGVIKDNYGFQHCVTMVHSTKEDAI